MFYVILVSVVRKLYVYFGVSESKKTFWLLPVIDKYSFGKLPEYYQNVFFYFRNIRFSDILRKFLVFRSSYYHYTSCHYQCQGCCLLLSVPLFGSIKINFVPTFSVKRVYGTLVVFNNHYNSKKKN